MGLEEMGEVEEIPGEQINRGRDRWGYIEGEHKRDEWKATEQIVTFRSFVDIPSSTGHSGQSVNNY